MRRSKDDVREAAGRRSLTGPGNPYWNRPLGSTNCLRVPAGEEIAGTEDKGVGRGGPVTVVVVVVETAVGGRVSRFEVEYIAAVAAAPAAAPPAAMIAKVSLDMIVMVRGVRVLLHGVV